MREPAKLLDLPVLKYLLAEEITIAERAADVGIPDTIAFGIGRALYLQKGDYGSLNAAQLKVAYRVIRPLVERVRCDGPVGLLGEDDESSCIHSGIVEGAALLKSYEEQNFLCQRCRDYVEARRVSTDYAIEDAGWANTPEMKLRRAG